MKKILSLVLAAIMLMGMVSFAGAEVAKYQEIIMFT